MLVFNPIQDLDPNDSYTKKLSSGHQTLMTEHPSSLRKVWKIGEKYKYWNSANPGLILQKLISGMPNTPKSHDQSFCAYLMRYDAHLQSHLRSWPKWYLYQKKLKSNENNSSYRPDTKHRAPRLIKKSVKNWGKIQILKFSKTRHLHHVSPGLLKHQVWIL